ncbi:MAG: molybdenum cofactor biosynthesis protein [Deltaproteobacteria bacterium]|nr:molybdenum cofactor biosynthesis protein [Deltaproteobacteria bacterium]
MTHKDNILKNLNFGIISVSSTRNIKEDKSGDWIKEAAEKNGHKVVYRSMAKDDKKDIIIKVSEALDKFKTDALILTGGTGLSEKDVTVEAISPLFDKTLTAFSEVFTLVSYNKIGAAAALSGACAGIIKKKVVFLLPGSLNACQDACNEIIFSEIGHIVKHLRQND